MTDLILPPNIPCRELGRSLTDLTSRFVSPTTGNPRSVTRPGRRWNLRLAWAPQRGQNAATLDAFIAASEGGGNRVWITPPGYVQRGSFPSQELIPNNTFLDGTTGYNSSSQYSRSSSDALMRATRIACTGANAFALYRASATTVTPYLPYVARYMVLVGRGAFPSGFSAYDITTTQRIGAITTTPGMIKGAFVPSGSTMQPALLDESTAEYPGDFLLIPYVSLSQCALIDNGQNWLTYSDQIDNAAWTKSNVSATANAFTAPDGTTTGEKITENSSNASHYIYQQATRTSAVADWCIAGAFRRGDTGSNLRDRVLLSVRDVAVANHGANATFDLSAGTIAVAAAAIGSGANPRAYISSLGNGWYYCAVVCQMPASGTTVGGMALMVSNPSTNSYTGDNASNIGAWRMTLAQSSLPVRLVQTTGAALNSGTGQQGAGVYLKGMPASTSALLLPGDFLEIAGELKQVTARVDSDAAGLAYAQIKPNLRVASVDNAPVIFNSPMAKCALTAGPHGVTITPGLFYDVGLEFTEAV